MPLEQIWDSLLSRESGVVRQTFATLDEQEQAAVLAHFHKMVSEPGWHPEQRISAKAALEALGESDH